VADIPLEASVECTDGPCGKSVSVIVNPATRKVTYIVVQDKSFLDPDQRLVPVDQIDEVKPQKIRLACSKADLSGMEPFIERHFVEDVYDDPAYWYAVGDMYLEPYVTPIAPLVEEVERVPSGQLAVRRGTWVEATDGHVGTVGELVFDPESEQVTHFVLEEGHLWGKKEVTLPLSAIDRIAEDTIYLKLDKGAVEQLPAVPLTRHYRRAQAAGRDVELLAKVYDDPDAARNALEFVQDLHRRRVLKILDAAVLVKREDGTLALDDTKDLKPRTGRVLGAITGGLIGLLAGPVGAVVGALAGLGVGGLAAKHIDWGFSDRFLEALQAHLQPGTSALVLLVETEWLQPLSDALADDKGVILHETLTDELVQEFMDQGDEDA
jgi:uncharacterized membrane protein/sporulation protein YlmC with PRC-barrel domain